MSEIKLKNKQACSAGGQGFTLIELLVAIAIIGILAMMIQTSVMYAKEYAKRSKARHALAEIYTAVGLMINDTNVWPGHKEVEAVESGASGNEICGDGCPYSITSPQAGIVATDGTYSNWSGPYVYEIELDPWGNEYFFDTDYSVNIDNEPCDGGGSCSEAVVIGSYGKNGVGNNLYDSDDIIKIIKK